MLSKSQRKITYNLYSYIQKKSTNYKGKIKISIQTCRDLENYLPHGLSYEIIWEYTPKNKGITQKVEARTENARISGYNKGKWWKKVWETALQQAQVTILMGAKAWRWELDHKEGWVPKNLCFLTMVLEKTFESPVVSKEIKTVSPKENQPWIFNERTAAEAEAPILWPPDAKRHPLDSDAAKDWEWKATTGWDGWMASSTQWTWIWANPGR